jgi:hypothetical protein
MRIYLLLPTQSLQRVPLEEVIDRTRAQSRAIEGSWRRCCFGVAHQDVRTAPAASDELLEIIQALEYLQTGRVVA